MESSEMNGVARSDGRLFWWICEVVMHTCHSCRTVTLMHFPFVGSDSCLHCEKNKLVCVSAHCSCWVDKMFTTLQPSLNIHRFRGQRWTTRCGNSSPNLWGYSSAENISLLASMQPSDIQEAIIATGTSAVGRTKLRLVYASARYKFGLDPVDVGAPPPSAVLEQKTTVSRGEGGLSLKIKVASVFDQASRDFVQWRGKIQ